MLSRITSTPRPAVILAHHGDKILRPIRDGPIGTQFATTLEFVGAPSRCDNPSADGTPRLRSEGADAPGAAMDEKHISSDEPSDVD